MLEVIHASAAIDWMGSLADKRFTMDGTQRYQGSTV